MPHLNLSHLPDKEKALMFVFLLWKSLPTLFTNLQLVKFGH